MKKLSILILLCIFILDLNAQVNLQQITFCGKVKSDNETPLSGVAVTDGYNISVTNKKGEYTLLSNATAQFVYITIPAGYKIPMAENSPCFFRRVTDHKTRKQHFDFSLSKQKNNDNKHVMIVWADPQVAFDEEMPKLQTATTDVIDLVRKKYSGESVYGLVCGDIIAEISKEPRFYKPIKQMLAQTGIPFFYAVGNHDMDVNGRSTYASKETFKKEFGPTYYSFNRGKIHYIVLDDVFFVARSYLSIGYIDESQLNWLAQDLDLIPKGSTVVVSFHIPSYSPEARKKAYNKELMTQALQNRNALYALLKPYNAHIFSGHKHYNDNFVITDSLFEHLHAAVCGIFWQAPYSSDGTPLGYGVYEFDGDQVSWYYKSTGYDKNFQFKAYPTGTSSAKPDAIIANVWNYDPSWKVYWYEDGIKMGEMTQYTGYDPAIVDYVNKNSAQFKYKYIGAGETDHLFFAIPKSKHAQQRVEVVDRSGNTYTQDIVYH